MNTSNYRTEASEPESRKRKARRYVRWEATIDAGLDATTALGGLLTAATNEEGNDVSSDQRASILPFSLPLSLNLLPLSPSVLPVVWLDCGGR